MKLIPTFPDAFFTETVNLEGSDFALTFTYNQREDAYYLSIATTDGTDLAVGVKVVANWPLLHKYATTGLPPGEMFAFSSTADISPPGLGELGEGQRCTLYYLTRAEQQALGM